MRIYCTAIALAIVAGKLAVQEAANYGTFVPAHAHGAEGIRRAIRAGVRSIEHGSIADDEALQLMKKLGAWLVADIWNGDYIDSVGTKDGWPEEILNAGKFADLIAGRGDARTDVHRFMAIDFVMKGGRVVKEAGRLVRR